ncbi:pyridoxamine 5-phosphate oxidase [Scytonema hofmannii PCC 7110]|uniref:Pyridoxamine 5-phosphate oxidase n=1 Tax=Scytonema hofmannii PCC 7110 TaxID=128403 RepID=A0A139XG23_9CYAN|nr:pyridoxamine 5'-phosphate oxidase family protein [Scytonema hofmannii]KYC43621.1 pyridoxamine 5-phosphate oxidase [Scytonema hofmannii PCC 7110]
MDFHSGEIAIQNHAGVREEAQQLRRMLGNIIKPAAQEFLRNQQLAVASTVDAKGRVWASLLTGDLGFVRVLNKQTLEIHPTFLSRDLLNQNLASHNAIGLLVIDLANRRRLRLNGKANLPSDDKIIVELDQVFFNCPKYIQSRHIETELTQSLQQPEVLTRDALSQTDESWITQADTFFIASYHPEVGADASHRGGFPGFVRVINSHKLVFPDYAGNNMFQTLGNLLVNPYTGLLFVNFESGHTLQLTGQAKVIWEAKRLSEFAGAQRLVEFDIEQVLESRNVCPLRWRFGEYSPANPS